MKNLSDFYTDEYLTESTKLPGDMGQENTLGQHADAAAVLEPDDLEFDLDDEVNETYYAGGNEGDKRNKGVYPEIPEGGGSGKSKKKKAVKEETNESFQELYDRVMISEMEDYEDDMGGGMEEEEYSDESGDETVEVNVSEVRAVIDQLEALIGGGGGYEDEEYSDDIDDDFPTESWDGGAGSQELGGDYSGKAKADKGTTHLKNGKDSNNANAKVGAKPHNNGGSTGSQELDGEYDGKAKADKGTRHLKNGKDANNASAKTGYKKARGNKEEDLFGA